MKIILSILFLAPGILGADKAERDPFVTPEKTALDLAGCIRGHKTLRDVPIIYGRLGDEAAEVAEKAKNGDVIMGGCFRGVREHWVVCRTCGLRFDDEHGTWLDVYPRDDLAAESEINPRCTPETIRNVLSKEMQQIALGLTGKNPPFLSCSSWLDPSGIVGERVVVQTSIKKSDFLAKIEAWLRQIEAPENVALDTLNADYRTLSWKVNGRTFAASQHASGENGFFVCIEWHIEKKEDPQGGAGQSPTNSDSESEFLNKYQPEPE